MPRKLEDKIAELETLYAEFKESGGLSEFGLNQLSSALCDASNLVVSKAAWFAGESRSRELIPDLLKAFDRLMIEPLKRDKSCLGKNAIILALYGLDHLDADFYRGLIKYRQMEPGFDKPDDMAIDVRRTAAFGLAASNHHRAIMDLVMMLSDPISTVRISVVEAVSTLAPQLAEAALRQKVASGDSSPEVMDECFRKLIEVNREDSIPLVTDYLTSEELGDYAAFALGESRDTKALETLISAYRNRVLPTQVLIQAISLARIDEAVEFLIGLIRDESEDIAEQAYASMESYSDRDYEKARQAFFDRF